MECKPIINTTTAIAQWVTMSASKHGKDFRITEHIEWNPPMTNGFHSKSQ